MVTQSVSGRMFILKTEDFCCKFQKYFYWNGMNCILTDLIFISTIISIDNCRCCVPQRLVNWSA